MKLISFSTILFTALFITSCDSKPTRPGTLLSPEQIQQSNLEASRPDAVKPMAGGAASGVDHYTCPNGHPGSDFDGTCPICGAALQHNQAWHDQPQSQTAATTPTTPTPSTEPDRNADGIWHYICPNGHEGGAGSAVPCPVCGTALVHNDAYHNSPNALQQSVETITNPSPAESGQNAKGVWHYICPNGHSGGAGSATPCPVCGTTLVHNDAYHSE